MPTINFALFYRSTVGFDRLFTTLDQLSGADNAAPSYPPYNHGSRQAHVRTVDHLCLLQRLRCYGASRTSFCTKRPCRQTSADEKRGRFLSISPALKKASASFSQTNVAFSLMCLPSRR